MTKTICHTILLNLLVIWDLLVTHPSPAIDDFKNYAGDIWFCFRHNVFKNYLQDLKLV